MIPFNHGKVPATTATKEIAQRLKSLTGETLLFLRQIDRIEWQIANDCSGNYRVERPFAATLAR